MNTVALTASGLKKTFNRRLIFSDISFSLTNGNSLAIAGRNGSGKSTLVKILAGLLSPTKGKCDLSIDGKEVSDALLFRHLGFVSPYLQMYDEFSGLENLTLSMKIRGLQIHDDEIRSLLEKVNLEHRKNDLVRTYSSGMKQRLKYAFALLHQPPVLILDEPTSNLDAEGIGVVYQIIEDQKKKGMIIVATNDAADQQLCEQIIDLNILPVKEEKK